MSDYILALVFTVTITLSPPLFAAENCSDAHYSDFDFLVGDWLVHSKDGKACTHNNCIQMLACVRHTGQLIFL